MRIKLHIAAKVGCGLLLVLVVGLVLLLLASQHEPGFYRRAIAVEPAAQKQASDEMLQQASALASDVEREGSWQAVFTAAQINGWLAVDLAENHPDALPEVFRDPRVAIRRDRLILACRLQRGSVSSVVTLTMEPFLPKPNLLGLRICSVRAGLVPVPMTGILDQLSEQAAQMGLHLRWRQAHGDPVALISIPAPRDEDGKRVQIEALRVDSGEIYVAGTTERLRSEVSRNHSPANTNRQR